MVNDSPEYLKNVTNEVNTNNIYWNSIIIGVLADAHYDYCLEHIDRFQFEVLSKCLQFIHEFDMKFIQGNVSKNFLEECNQTISDYFKKKNSELLKKVLFSSSLQMKNAYSRSDA